MERNINVIPVDVIKDQTSTYPSGCEQWLTFPVQELGEYKVITGVPANANIGQCNNAVTIGSVVGANEFPPATSVLTVKVIDPVIGTVYVDKASYLSAQNTWNACCVSLPELATPGTFVTPVGNTQTVTNWADVPNATNYVLERSLSNSFTSPVVVYSGSVSGYTNTGLTNGTTYYYRVKAQAPGYLDSDYAFSSVTPAP